MGWVVGAMLSIFGSIASNLGVNIQKYSFIRQAQRPLNMRTSHWKDIRWLSGLGLVIFGSLGDFAALSMVAQSIVAPLASTTLVTNVIFAHFWLHEHVGRRELIGTALIICGSTLAVVFGDHNTRRYSNDDLVRLIGGAWFLVYAILVVLMCALGLMLHRKITPIKAALVEAIKRYETAVEANDAQAADWEDEVIARLEMQYMKWVKIHPFALCALSGAFGAQSVLFGKCFAELLSTTIEGDNQLFNFFPWVCLIFMAMTVASQLHFLAVALNYFDALYAVPVFQCFFIGVSTLGGALYFREVYEMSAGEAVAFVCGLLMTLGGVAVLSTRKMSQRRVVNRVAAGAATDGVHVGLIGVGGGIKEAIPEGDEEAGDGIQSFARPGVGRGSGQDDGLLPRRGGAERSSSVSFAETLPREFEMSENVGYRRRGGSGGTGAVSSSSVHSTLGVAASTPVLRDSARLPGFAEKAAAEGAEFAELKATIGDTQDSLAAKLAAAGYGAGAGPAGSSETTSLLAPTSQPKVISPALAIQIEADQAYINRHDKGVPAHKKRASVAAARFDADVALMTQLEGPSSALSPGSVRSSLSSARSASFHEGGSASGGSGSGENSRSETPRSAYARERSNSFSNRGSPAHSGANTPVSLGRRLSRALDGDRPESPTNLAPVAGAGAGGHARGGSLSFASPKVGLPPSAMFSGALLESAQELPAVDNDTRIQRLTRLSTVGHWVAGLHAQMPVVGGVAQAILQAKEMQALFDGQAKEEEKLAAAAAALEKKDDASVRVPIAEDKQGDEEEEEPTPSPDAPSIELADFKTSSMTAALASPPPAASDATSPAKSAGAASASSSSDSSAPVTVIVTAPTPPVGTSPSAPAASSSSSSSSSAVTSPVATSSSAAAAAAAGGESPPNLTVAVPPSSSPSVSRVIEFDDDYDPFSTQAGGKKISHRDPFKLTSDDELGLGSAAGSSIIADESNFLSSPTSAFAALKPTPAYTPATAEATAAMLAERAAAAKKAAAEKPQHSGALAGLFSPLASTHKHPLQQPPLQPSPPLADDDADRAPSTPPASATAALVSPSPERPLGAVESDLTPVEEWAAALRIQSLYRGQHIRRQLRDKKLSMSNLSPAHTEEFAALAAATQRDLQQQASSPDPQDQPEQEAEQEADQRQSPPSQLGLDDLTEDDGQLSPVDPLLPSPGPSSDLLSSPAMDPSAHLFSFDDPTAASAAAAASPRTKQAQADEEVTDIDGADESAASAAAAAAVDDDGDEPAVQDEEELNLM